MREKAGKKFSADSAFSWPDSAFSRDFLASIFFISHESITAFNFPRAPLLGTLTADWHLRPY